MKSGHGRFILRGGSGVAVKYLPNYFWSRCSGALIGGMTAVGPADFSHELQVRLVDGPDIVLMVIGHSEIHITFVARSNACATGMS